VTMICVTCSQLRRSLAEHGVDCVGSDAFLVTSILPCVAFGEYFEQLSTVQK
jgi:hypothetical protein